MGEVVKIYQKDNVQKRKFRVMSGNGAQAQNPMGGSDQPMGGYTQPMGGSNQPMGGNPQSMGGSNQPVGGNPQFMGGYTQPMGGYIPPMGSYIPPMVSYIPMAPDRRDDSGKIANHVAMVCGLVTLIGTIMGAIITVIIPITQHADAISEIRSSINDLDEDIDTLSSDIKSLSEFVYKNYGNQGDNSRNDAEDKIKKVRIIGNNFLEMDLANNEPELPELSESSESPEPPESQSGNWEKLVFVAEDEDGNKLNSDDLQNVTFITSYMEGEKEVYFLGQYNEKNRWNGECILNVYDGENLDSVLDAIYNNGELYSYKRVSIEKDGTWKVTDKIDKKDYKIGETWTYNVSDTYQKKISFDNYDESMILSYEDFSYLEDEELISYYNGKTSDGSYNEDEQDSYLIEYFKKDEIDFGENKRVIRTFYKGNFVNGKLEDESNKSWEIARRPDITYMIYEGSFSDNSADYQNIKDLINPAGYEDIAKKLKEEGFEKYLDEFLIDY